MHAIRAQSVLLKEDRYTERKIVARLSISKTALHVTIVRNRKTGLFLASTVWKKTQKQLLRLIDESTDSLKLIRGLLLDILDHAFLRKRHQSVYLQ